MQKSDVTNAERRKKVREETGFDSAFIEIDHSFGPLKKSVYKIIEYNEFGLSFLVPHSDGYFMVGTPLKFVLIQTSRQLRRLLTGIVRYYHPVYQQSGERCFKIGVEILSSYRDIAGRDLRLRAERISAGEEFKSNISFSLDAEIRDYELADYSRYSAAFFCTEDDLLSFKPSLPLEDVTIMVDTTLIYEGAATITRTYKDNSNRFRVVLQPRGNLIDIDAAERNYIVRTAATEIQDRIAKHHIISDIDTNFKAAVSDLRYFLEDTHQYVDSPHFQSVHQDQEKLLNGIFPSFADELGTRITAIDAIVQGLQLSDKNQLPYRTYYQQHLLPLLLLSPYIHRAYFKPLGYSGDYEMMRLNHEDSFEGGSIFAKLLSKYTTSSHFGEVARTRTDYMRKFLTEILTHRSGKPTALFSVACGPALEIRELLATNPELTQNVSLTLLDQEINALEYTLNSLYESKIRHESEMRISFVHQNLQEFLRGAATENAAGKFDLIYSFGLFDYFEKAVAKFIIRGLLHLLKPQGKLMVANISLDGFHHRSFMEFGMDWFLVYRNRQELAELAEGLGDGYSSSVDELQEGTFKFLTISAP
jgi:2-polyprenyl-3-methyl-5-hydroxy-6-metoxy-1,4-benzoquinol methylase